ncbi:hypothetical protein [Aeoliella sp.]|uniref:hypothetical protein n=1 Tax=Aeoliella sp. TaxID=2795800 RepID=UPI003CCBAA53
MALSHTERAGERQRGNGSARRVYTITGTEGESETDVYTYLLNTAADSISGLVIADASCDEIANVGDTVYYVGEVSYGLHQLPIPAQAVDEVRVSARGSATTVNIKHSQSTRPYPAPWWVGDGETPGTPTDFKGKVGVDEDNNVAGVDIYVPQNVLSVSNVLPAATITPAYQYACEQLVGKINSEVYRSRAIGTLLCNSVSFAQRDVDNFAIDAEFMFSANRTGLTIGDVTGIDKGGWEYIWAYNRSLLIDGRILPAVAQVNVETIYESADFESVLGF